MSQLKKYFFIVLTTVVCSCSSREPLKIIHDYEIGFTLDGKIRTYYYWREPEKDTLMITFVPSVTDGVHYVTEYSRTPARILGERKFKIEKGIKDLIEAYEFYYADDAEDSYDSLRLEIQTIEVIPGEKYNGGFFKYKVRTKSNIISKYSIEETFLKDTTYIWKDEILPALKFREKSHYSTFHRYVPFIPSTEDSDGFVVFAKGVGLVYTHVTFREDKNTFTLVKVTEEYATVHTMQQKLLSKK